MKTATKRSWNKATQDLHGRWFMHEYEEERRQQRKKQTSVKMAARLQRDALISYSIWDLPLPRFQTFPQKDVKPTGEHGKCEALFCREFLQTILQKLELLDAVDVAVWTADRLCSGHLQTAKVPKTLPSGTPLGSVSNGSVFSLGIYSSSYKFSLFCAVAPVFQLCVSIICHLSF